MDFICDPIDENGESKHYPKASHNAEAAKKRFIEEMIHDVTELMKEVKGVQKEKSRQRQQNKEKEEEKRNEERYPNDYNDVTAINAILKKQIQQQKRTIYLLQIKGKALERKIHRNENSSSTNRERSHSEKEIHRLEDAAKRDEMKRNVERKKRLIQHYKEKCELMAEQVKQMEEAYVKTVEERNKWEGIARQASAKYDTRVPRGRKTTKGVQTEEVEKERRQALVGQLESKEMRIRQLREKVERLRIESVMQEQSKGMGSEEDEEKLRQMKQTIQRKDELLRQRKQKIEELSKQAEGVTREKERIEKELQQKKQMEALMREKDKKDKAEWKENVEKEKREEARQKEGVQIQIAHLRASIYNAICEVLQTQSYPYRKDIDRRGSKGSKGSKAIQEKQARVILHDLLGTLEEENPKNMRLLPILQHVVHFCIQTSNVTTLL